MKPGASDEAVQIHYLRGRCEIGQVLAPLRSRLP